MDPGEFRDWDEVERSVKQPAGPGFDETLVMPRVQDRRKPPPFPSDSDADHAEFLLTNVVGLDTSKPDMKDTPRRFVQALRELTTPDWDWEFTVFDTLSDEMVVVRDIKFASLCRHHILPFMGVCHVAYIPNTKLVGLSKIPRLVKQRSASLNVQEELTAEIATALDDRLEPKGVGVVMEAEHTCMTIRGALAPGTLTYTAAMLGVFGDHSRTAKAEFLSRINHR